MTIRKTSLALILVAGALLAGCSHTVNGVATDVKHDGRAVGHAVTGH